ncbi:MAG: EAL domain-containing protein [Nitrospinae bacterium]|nr:EAL domain-containing protein [Nitrospinota bacterium]MBL7019896.1 EAL domain-containing protein [Nitrospinaceae bacterium]
MNNKTTLEFLEKVDFLKNLPGLDTLATNCKEEFLPQKAFLFKEGDIGEAMYIITSGSLEVFKENRVIANRTSGEYIGEMALLGNQIRSASARATTDVQAIEIRKEYFLSFLSTNPMAFLPLFQTLTSRWKEDLKNINSDNLELKNQIKLNQRFSLLLDDTVNEIFILNPDTYQIIQANLKSSQNLGYTREELSNTTFNETFQDLSQGELSEKLQNLVKKKQAQVSFENQHKRKDGSNFPVEVRIQYSEIEDPPLIYAIVEDISDRKAMENHIKHLAFYDSLTELPNRNLIKDRLNIMLAQATRTNTKVAILFMGLDNFKNVNDSLGHEAGDQFLVQVANRFEKPLRKEDTFGRLGGDEFIILFPALKNENFVAKLAQRVLDIMDQPLELKGKQFHSTFSVGVAIFPQDGKDIETLFKNSSIAMYQAKESGGNAYRLYESSMHDKIMSRLTLEQDLRKALKNKEFELHYQPKVSMRTGEIEGLEALIRWNHPDGKEISPAVFIPIAEESQIINKIGEWTFIEACRQIREWQQKYDSAVKIGVNLSGRQFDQPNLVEKINSIIKSEGIDAKYLEIEVTETAIMSNIKEAIEALKQFRELGIHISVDDFGSGYTSLGYLTKLPINTLKIDQSFISGCTDSSNIAIIQGIIAISQKMGFQTIAEGVETREQLNLLKSLGCDQFQGYLFSKPLPAREIVHLIWPAQKASIQAPPF